MNLRVFITIILTKVIQLQITKYIFFKLYMMDFHRTVPVLTKHYLKNNSKTIPNDKSNVVTDK